MTEELVSVIMPVYNGEKFLDRSIKSVLNQSYSQWELIIIDDQSKDNSVSVIKKYQSDDRIHLLLNDANLGIPSTRNRGIRFSKGEYIALLDQDDEWLTDKLDKQISKLQEHNTSYGLIYCNHNTVYDNGKIIPVKLNISPGDTLAENRKKLFFNNFISSLTVVFRRECVDRVGLFNEEITWGGDDYDLWLRIAEYYQFAFIDEVLAIRYNHGANYSYNKKDMMKASLSLCEEYTRKHPEFKKYKNSKRAVAYYRYGIESLKRENYLDGAGYIFISLLLSPAAFIELSKTFKNQFS